MSRPSLEEQYGRGVDVLNFVVYHSTSAAGEDEVLQHKMHGVEMAHITLHPDGSINLRERREGSGGRLVQFTKDGLAGFTPAPSERLQKFLRRIRGKV